MTEFGYITVDKNLPEFGGMTIMWNADGVGFGEIELFFEDGVLGICDEQMGEDFVMEVLRQVVHEASMRRYPERYKND